MTVILGSICDNGKSIVLAADRMFTYMGGKYEYEHDTSKLYKINSFVIGAAGNVIFGDELITLLKNELENPSEDSPLKQDNITVGIIAEVLADIYSNYRQFILERLYLNPLGLSWEQYNEDHGKYNPDFHSNIYQHITEFELEVELMLVGFENGKPKIFSIMEPGMALPFHSVGYFSIGIGYEHILNYYVVNNYRMAMPLKEALYFAFEAKKNSEVAAGIGKDTDIMIIKADGKTKEYLNESNLVRELNDLFTKKIKEEKNLYNEVIKKRIEEIKLE